MASIRQSTVCFLQQQPQFHCPSLQKGSFSRKNIDRIGADDFFEAEVNNRSFQQSEKNRSKNEAESIQKSTKNSFEKSNENFVQSSIVGQQQNRNQTSEKAINKSLNKKSDNSLHVSLKKNLASLFIR